jgi:hypothetical protein
METFSKVLFNSYTFKVRSKAEIYQDDVKVRSSVLDASIVDYVTASLEMITFIDSLKV